MLPPFLWVSSHAALELTSHVVLPHPVLLSPFQSLSRAAARRAPAPPPRPAAKSGEYPFFRCLLQGSFRRVRVFFSF